MNADVVIIGAGPAGIFTALEMIKKGRKKSDYAFLCGIYVFGMLSMVEVTLNLKFIILLAFVGLAWEKEKAQDNNDEW